MKKVKTYLVVVALLFASGIQAQLTGTKNIPGDYATLAAAITDLNAQGVGSGGVVINLLTGNPETAPAGGFSITATGTSANTIIITGNSNTITAATPQAAGNLNDAIFKIIGGDYITIQGFTLQENASNTTSTIATNNMTEWGIAILYASATDGAQNITIQNNTISLNRTYVNTFGIYSSSRHTQSDVITVADISAPSGANNSLHIYSNNISNVNIGICVIGSQTDSYMATGLDIGGASGSTANTISNFGTNGTFSAYVSLKAGVDGIYVNNNINVNLSYNSVTSSIGGTTTGTLRGIYLDATGALPVSGSITNTINNNSISLKSGSASDSIIGIHNLAGNSMTTSSTNNNDFNNTTHTVAASGRILFILYRAVALNVNINNNTFTNLSVNTTGDVFLIEKNVTHPANVVINVNNNSIVTSFTKTGGGGTFRGYSSTQATSSGSETNNGNNLSNVAANITTTAINLWGSSDGPSALPFGCSKTITNNVFNNINGGSGAITILTVSASNNGSSNNVSGNTISNVTGAGAVTGLSSPGGTQNIFSNLISGLSTTGASAVSGISVSGGNIQNVYKNKIYNLSANNASGTVNGILLSSMPASSTTIYNNLIGDLKTPSANAADVIRGVSITAVNVSTGTADVAFNSIFINASSTGTNFGSSGIFQTINTNSLVNVLTSRNNIIVNTSTPKGTGLTVAFRRSAATNLNNFSSLSNNNLFYAGTPGSSRLVYYDGTNSDQTLSAYKTRVSPRDANSVTESPTFLSTTGSSPDFLHIDASIATQLESGATAINFITDDYDNNTRDAVKPDIGADEFSGTANDQTGPSILYTPLSNTFSTANRTIIATITDPAGVASAGSAPLIYYRKGTSGSYFSSVATSITGNDYTFTIDYANVTGGSVAAGDVIQYYIAAQDVLGNVTTISYGGSGATPPGSTAPATPNQYHLFQTYTWQGSTNDYQVSTNWSPVRTTPDASDILVFDGSVTASPTVSNIPVQTITKLVFMNNVNATLNAATAGNTLTLSYAAGQTSLDVQAGSIVNLGVTTAVSLAYDLAIDGQIGTVAGTLNINSTSVFTTTNSITTVPGTIAIKVTVTSGTPINSTINSLVFSSGSTLQYERTNGGTIPTASYNSTSTINMVGAFTASVSWPSAVEAAGNLTYNSSGSAAQSLSSLLTSIMGSLLIQNTGTGSFATGTGTATTISVAGNATINNGTWNISGNQMSIAGNLVQNGGTIVKTSTAAGITWAAANISQTAGTLSMAVVDGVFSLSASSGNMNFAGAINGGTHATGGLTLAFTGAGNQTLNTTGATVTNKAGITVNKTSGNCTLLSDFTVNSGAAVSLTNGKLTIAASKTLTIASGASTTGTGSSNYFVSDVNGANIGKLKYAGLTTSAQSFAIGTATNYMPVTITPVTTGSSFAVGVFEGATQNGAPDGTPVTSPDIDDIVNAEWQIDNSVVSTTAGITLGWVASQEGSNFSSLNNLQIGILRYNGTSYDIATGSGDNAANTATSSFNSFSPFIVGKISNSCVAGTTATWMGTIDNDYNKPGNWSTNCVPSGTMNILIPSGTPTLTAGSAAVKNISISPGATLNLNDGAVLNIKGDFVNDGTIASAGSPDTGKTIFNGTAAQNISGTGVYSHVEIDNVIGAVVITHVSVKTILVLPGANLTVLTSKTLTVLQ